jgi:hypothetical protein
MCRCASPSDQEYAHLAASENRSEETADGRMATEAARLKRKDPQEERRKTVLTHTGLLMEGMWRYGAFQMSFR